METPNLNEKTEKFLDSYEKRLHSFSLPERISGQYTLSNCMKHSADKEIYLLSDKQERLYILKKERNLETTRIRQEHQMFDMLSESKTASFMPKCIDYWEDTDWCYLLRTYIEGDSLAAYADAHPVLSINKIANFSLQICQIIQTLHDRQPPVIHRDIKPENFILQKDTNILYLIDFDTARQYIPQKIRDTHLFGTPDIAAPEQFGFHQSDVRTDIYSIGKTMLYMTTGTTSEDSLRDKSIPSGLRKIICRATSFSPDERYADLNALQKDLHRYKYLQSFTVPLHQLAIRAAFFLFGVGIGLGIGINFTGKRTSPAKSSVSTNAPTLQNDTSPSEQTNAAFQKTQDSRDSLLSISGAKQIDLWKYQNQVDAIILSYYNTDYDKMITQIETLVQNLYDDDALMQTMAEDYSTYESLPSNFWDMNVLATMRVRLAYRKQILKTKLGSYDKYQKSIVSILGDTLSHVKRNELPASLYYYATLPKQERDDYYEFALSDILCDVYSGFDIADGFTPPM